MVIVRRWKLAVITAVTLSQLLGAQSIEHYRVIKGCVKKSNGDVLIVRRVFEKANRAYYLALHIDDLKSEIVLKSGTQSIKGCQNPNYDRLKMQALADAKALQNAGITAGLGKGYALTVDLCPASKKGYERDFFLRLIAEQKGFPVTLSITGKWIKKHQKAFAELRSFKKSGKLSIIWMNHGFLHPYHRGVKIEKNFILSADANQTLEALGTEKLLLSYGEMPSIFYRFAGLVSSEKIIKKWVNQYGLIPIGSQAWLAKGESIKAGSIVLIHGNKNEPLGIERFEKISQRGTIKSLERLLIRK